MSPKLTVGSLFAGIGGFDLGLERTGGFQVVWQCEIDPYCQCVLAKHWPHVKRYGDIRDIKQCLEHQWEWDEWYASRDGSFYQGDAVQRVDVLCGGFPCQDISKAGKRAGITAERSGLWSEYVRLIRMVRPRYVVVENVAALLESGMGRVLGDLAEIGYDAEWDVLPACAFGASHIRERVWILSYPNQERPQRRILQLPENQRRRSFDASVLSVQLATNHWDALPTPRVCRGSDGVPNRSQRTQALGNAIVPQIATWIGQRILEAEALNA